MTHVITQPCIGTKSADCVEVCPVDCIYEAADQFYIHPGECIDCGACVTVCPVSAIFAEAEVPADQAAFIAKNVKLAQSGGKNMTPAETPPPKQAPEETPDLPRQVFAEARKLPAEQPQPKMEKPQAAATPASGGGGTTAPKKAPPAAAAAKEQTETGVPKKPTKEELASWDPQAILPKEAPKKATDGPHASESAASPPRQETVRPAKTQAGAEAAFEAAAKALEAAAAALRVAAKRP